MRSSQRVLRSAHHHLCGLLPSGGAAWLGDGGPRAGLLSIGDRHSATLLAMAARLLQSSTAHTAAAGNEAVGGPAQVTVGDGSAMPMRGAAMHEAAPMRETPMPMRRAPRRSASVSPQLLRSAALITSVNGRGGMEHATADGRVGMAAALPGLQCVTAVAAAAELPACGGQELSRPAAAVSKARRHCNSSNNSSCNNSKSTGINESSSSSIADGATALPSTATALPSTEAPKPLCSAPSQPPGSASAILKRRAGTATDTATLSAVLDALLLPPAEGVALMQVISGGRRLFPLFPLLRPAGAGGGEGPLGAPSTSPSSTPPSSLPPSEWKTWEVADVSALVLERACELAPPPSSGCEQLLVPERAGELAAPPSSGCDEGGERILVPERAFEPSSGREEGKEQLMVPQPQALALGGTLPWDHRVSESCSLQISQSGESSPVHTNRGGASADSADVWEALALRARAVLEPYCGLLGLWRTADLLYAAAKAGRPEWLPANATAMVSGATRRALYKLQRAEEQDFRKASRRGSTDPDLNLDMFRAQAAACSPPIHAGSSTLQPGTSAESTPPPPRAGVGAACADEATLQPRQQQGGGAADTDLDRAAFTDIDPVSMHRPQALGGGGPPKRQRRSSSHVGQYTPRDSFVSRSGRKSLAEASEAGAGRGGGSASMAADMFPRGGGRRGANAACSNATSGLLASRTLMDLSFTCYSLTRLERGAPPASAPAPAPASASASAPTCPEPLPPGDGLARPHEVWEVWNILAVAVTHVLRNHELDERCHLQLEAIAANFVLAAKRKQHNESSQCSELGMMQRRQNQQEGGMGMPRAGRVGEIATAALYSVLPSSWICLLWELEGAGLRLMSRSNSSNNSNSSDHLQSAASIALSLTKMGHYGEADGGTGCGGGTAVRQRPDGASLLFRVAARIEAQEWGSLPPRATSETLRALAFVIAAGGAGSALAGQVVECLSQRLVWEDLGSWRAAELAHLAGALEAAVRYGSGARPVGGTAAELVQQTGALEATAAAGCSTAGGGGAVWSSTTCGGTVGSPGPGPDSAARCGGAPPEGDLGREAEISARIGCREGDSWECRGRDVLARSPLPPSRMSCREGGSPLQSASHPPPALATPVDVTPFGQAPFFSETAAAEGTAAASTLHHPLPFSLKVDPPQRDLDPLLSLPQQAARRAAAFFRLQLRYAPPDDLPAAAEAAVRSGSGALLLPSVERAAVRLMAALTPAQLAVLLPALSGEAGGRRYTSVPPVQPEEVEAGGSCGGDGETQLRQSSSSSNLDAATKLRHSSGCVIGRRRCGRSLVDAVSLKLAILQLQEQQGGGKGSIDARMRVVIQGWLSEQS